MALLTFESRGVRLVLFEPAEKSCTKQIPGRESHVKVALLGIFLNGISWPLSLSLLLFYLLPLLSQRSFSIGEP